MVPWLENALMYAADRLLAIGPQRTPSAQQLNSVKLISHRGERDNVAVFENTIAAFDPLKRSGIWGIEFDVRWTSDLVPVVIHDKDGSRVFGSKFTIADHTWEECQGALPLVPSLKQIIDRFGRDCHLMIELKKEHYPDPSGQKSILAEHLSGLGPGTDFHIISLDCDLFAYVDFLPPQALLPIATTHAARFSDYALKNALGGITGHFLFMTSSMIALHHQNNQMVGSGFANSKRVLFREINKGVDWHFSNQALAMQGLVKAHL